MTSKKELQLAYCVAIVLLVVGVVSYAAYSAKAPDQPLRVMYESAAGKVMFTHETHLSESGYSLDCNTCHHHGGDTSSCGTCHLKVDGGFALSCLKCHESEDHADLEVASKQGVDFYSAESCADCHENVGDMTAMTSANAFHGQCIGCHAENEAGPQECNECHLK
jgi:hypothetical protein